MRVGLGEAGGKGVDEEVAVVAGVEIDLAADRRHAEGIAVAADAGDDTGDQMPGLRMVRLAEAQRIHRRDRPRAHGEDVAQDAADAGRRTLIGLDIGGVVVALHLEDHAVAVADIDDAGIFARSLDDPRPLVGSVRSHFFEDLYEQCSFHMAEKMPSSVKLGSRPIRSRMRWYSSGFSPCAAMSSGGDRNGRCRTFMGRPRAYGEACNCSLA